MLCLVFHQAVRRGRGSFWWGVVGMTRAGGVGGAGVSQGGFAFFIVLGTTTWDFCDCYGWVLLRGKDWEGC